jgi:hypothetical protein
VRAISVWRLSKWYIIRRPAGPYAHMPADSLDGRQSTLLVGQGVRGCRFRVLRWDPCSGGKVGPSDSDDDIPQVHLSVEVRVQYCSCWRANFGASDHDLRSRGPCPRSAYSHWSSSDVIKFAVCRVQCRVQDCVRASTSRTNAPPLSGRVVWLPAWCAGSRRRGLKYSPLCHTGRSGNNNNIELGATRYFARHAWWSSWLSCSFSATFQRP